MNPAPFAQVTLVIAERCQDLPLDDDRSANLLRRRLRQCRRPKYSREYSREYDAPRMTARAGPTNTVHKG
jgi:hypothetical protein